MSGIGARRALINGIESARGSSVRTTQMKTIYVLPVLAERLSDLPGKTCTAEIIYELSTE
jgi:hypothetical protein